METLAEIRLRLRSVDTPSCGISSRSQHAKNCVMLMLTLVQDRAAGRAKVQDQEDRDGESAAADQRLWARAGERERISIRSENQGMERRADGQRQEKRQEVDPSLMTAAPRKERHCMRAFLITRDMSDGRI